jgi:hypothetical protein
MNPVGTSLLLAPSPLLRSLIIFSWEKGGANCMETSFKLQADTQLAADYVRKVFKAITWRLATSQGFQGAAELLNQSSDADAIEHKNPEKE